MKPDRRKFLRIAGAAIGCGALYRAGWTPGSSAEADQTFAQIGRRSGEMPAAFSFVQLSDTHVGFQGPPDPLGSRAFERAVEMVNRIRPRPELAIFTGDLTHDADDRDEHARRMRRFREIAGRLHVALLKFIPGENDAALDGGTLFREHFGETSYSFDHRGVHFVALDNVSRGRPEVGPERLAWLKADLARFDRASPIVIFAHRPLFDLRPQWEWFTADGDKVTSLLSAYDNVTVLYGHIHRRDVRRLGAATHYGTRSLIFGFPDPRTPGERKPLPFDAHAPFKNLGIRIVSGGGRASTEGLTVNDVELSLHEFSGAAGSQQFLRGGEIG